VNPTLFKALERRIDLAYLSVYWI